MKVQKGFRIADSDLEIRESEDGNSILVLWSTGAKGLRNSFDGQYYEELEMSEEACDLTRLNKKAPFLLQHNQDISAQIGVVERSWIQDGMGMAEVRLSKRPDVAGYVQDIKDGILRNISVGYMVSQYEDVTPKGENTRVLRAVKWLPMELSCVAVGFDADAGILRSSEEVETEVKVIKSTEVRMTEEEKKMLEELEAKKKAEEEAAKEDKQQEGQEEVQEEQEEQASRKDEEEDKKEAERSLNIENLKQQAIQEYQTRCSEIKNAVKAAGLENEYAEELISRNLDMESASKEIFNKLEALKNSTDKKQEENKNMTKKEMAELALLNRVDAKRFKVERNNPYKQQSFIKILEAVVERNATESDQAFVKRATVSGDLEALLSNVANKLMLDTDGLEKFTYHRFSGQQTLKDFRTTPIVQLSGVNLNSKNEGADYQKATLVDSKEDITLEERGILVDISQKAIINDDLGALKALPARASASGHRDIEKRMYAMLALNSGDGPVLSDTKELFHADHNNTLYEETPNPAGIAAANQIMAAFQDDSGEPLDLRTKYIVCGPDLEFVAKQTANSAMVPNSSSSVNPYAGEIEVAVSSRVPANTWYAVADKDEFSALVYGTLEGMAEPQVETEVDFNSSNHKIKIEYPNAVAAASYKGIIRVSTEAEPV